MEAQHVDERSCASFPSSDEEASRKFPDPDAFPGTVPSRRSRRRHRRLLRLGPDVRDDQRDAAEEDERDEDFVGKTISHRATLLEHFN